jgi:hypothetical protein
MANEMRSPHRSPHRRHLPLVYLIFGGALLKPRPRPDQCLDVTAGSTGVNEEPYSWFRSLQTWECSNNGDPQQVFYEISG